VVSSANGDAVVVVAVMTMSQSAPSDGNDKDKDWSLCHCRGTRWDCRLYPMTTNRIIVICSMAGENLQEWYRLRCAPVSVFHRRLPLHSWLLLLTQQRLLPSMLVNSFSRCHSFSFFPPTVKTWTYSERRTASWQADGETGLKWTRSAGRRHIGIQT